MAISTPSSLGCLIDQGKVVCPISVKGSWTDICSNVEATAESSAVLLRPFSATSSYIVPGTVSVGTRLVVRMKYTAGTTVGTNPVFRFYGVYGKFDNGAFADDGTVYALRIDNADANATGVTITASTGAQIRDTTYEYTDPLPDLTGWDLMGAHYVLALIETAGSITSGTGTLQAMVLN
jgi:hypothetical protein